MTRQRNKRRLLLILSVGCVGLLPLQHAKCDEPYERWVGLLPKNKAVADADRLLTIMKEFQEKNLKPGECLQFFGKRGTTDLLKVVNEEGRGFTPPRSGYETQLYNKIKDFVEKNPGQKIDTETLFRLGLESCVDPQGGVSLQDTALTIHNIVRILARPESWLTQTHEPGVLIWTPFGDKQLTEGKDLPGWKGMTDDPAFPILQDLGGAKSTTEGRKTFAELMNAANTPAALKQKMAERDAKIDARIADLRAKIATEKKMEEEDKKLAGTWTPDKMKSPDYTQKQTQQFERMNRLADLERQLAGLELEKKNPMLHAEDMQGYFFDTNKGVFAPQYGAKGQLGNGGCTYYYWLGALVRTLTPPGRPAQDAGWWYERGQKWLGSEDEYARGLVQLSHYDGGGKFGGMAMGAIMRCNMAKKPGPDKPSWFASAYKQLHDWYCTNRPEIQSDAPLPEVISKGNAVSRDMPWAQPQK